MALTQERKGRASEHYSANEQERDQVAFLSEAVQEATGESVEIVFVDRGYTGDDPDADAASYGIQPVVVSLPDAKKGFVPCRGAGPWSGRTAGWRGSAAWLGITSASARLWRGCTTSHSAS